MARPASWTPGPCTSSKKASFSKGFKRFGGRMGSSTWGDSWWSLATAAESVAAAQGERSWRAFSNSSCAQLDLERNASKQSLERLKTP